MVQPTTDDISDITVLRELEKIKNFVIDKYGKGVKGFKISEETETTVTLTILTVDEEEFNVELQKGATGNYVTLDTEQTIVARKEFTGDVKATNLELENVHIHEDGNAHGLIIESKTDGVKISQSDLERESVLDFANTLKVRDPYVPTDAPAGTKDKAIKTLYENKQNKMTPLLSSGTPIAEYLDDDGVTVKRLLAPSGGGSGGYWKVPSTISELFSAPTTKIITHKLKISCGAQAWNETPTGVTVYTSGQSGVPNGICVLNSNVNNVVKKLSDYDTTYIGFLKFRQSGGTQITVTGTCFNGGGVADSTENVTITPSNYNNFIILSLCLIYVEE